MEYLTQQDFVCQFKYIKWKIDKAKTTRKIHHFNSWTGEVTWINLLPYHTIYYQYERMLHEYLINSISKEVNNIISTHHNEYNIGTPSLPSGIFLLKIIIRERYLDTNSTTRMFWYKLSKLDSYIQVVGNITQRFN